MARTRSEKIYGRIALKLGAFDPKVITPSFIYATMDDVQKLIAEDFLCMEASVTLPVVKGTSKYDLTTVGGTTTGFYRLKLISPPVGTVLFPQETTLETVERLTRIAYTTTGLYTRYFRIWNNELQLVPTPSITADWVLWFYQTPTTSISASVNPSTPPVFDKYLEAASLKQLALIARPDLVSYAENQHAIEYQRAVNAWRRTKTVPHEILNEDF